MSAVTPALTSANEVLLTFPRPTLAAVVPDLISATEVLPTLPNPISPFVKDILFAFIDTLPAFTSAAAEPAVIFPSAVV